MAQPPKAEPDYVIAGCVCANKQEFTDEMRDEHGLNLHAPYCPIGNYERDMETIMFTPFGTQDKEIGPYHDN